MRYRGITFPDQGARVISQHESVLVLDAARPTSIFEVNIWGTTFYGVYLRTDDSPDVAGIHINQFVGSVLMFLVHADKMFQALGYSGPILADLAFRSIMDVKWVQASKEGFGFPQRVGGSELDDEVTFKILTTTENLREKPDGVLIEILRQIFFSVNLPDHAALPANLAFLVNKGYDFNNWPVPENLRM